MVSFGGKGGLVIEKGSDILGMLMLLSCFFFFFQTVLLVLCELYTMFPNPTHYPEPLLTLYLCNLPPQQSEKI